MPTVAQTLLDTVASRSVCHVGSAHTRFFTQLYTEFLGRTPTGHQDTRTLPLYNIRSGSVGLAGHSTLFFEYAGQGDG